MSKRQRASTLYVRNIPYETKHEDLRRTFGKFGHIHEVTIPVDYVTGQMKGYAFVEYEDPRDAEDAQRRMHHNRFLGREVDVELSYGVKKTPTEMKDLTRKRQDRDRGSRRQQRSRSRDRSRRDRSRSPPKRNSRRSASRESRGSKKVNGKGTRTKRRSPS